MQSIIIAFIIALIISIATFLGGLLPLTKLFKKIDIRYLVGFSSGAIISIAIIDLLPEAGIKYPIAIAAGFFLIYLIEKLVLIYACGEHECEVHPTGWPALIGIATESLADGLIIAAGYVINPGLGITIAAAVLVHEIPRGFSTTIIMKAAKKTNKAAVSALAVDAFFTPLGVLLAPLFPMSSLPIILAFAAGTFLYVGASDLLPEAHKKFNIYVVASVVLGAVVVAII